VVTTGGLGLAGWFLLKHDFLLQEPFLEQVLERQNSLTPLHHLVKSKQLRTPGQPACLKQAVTCEAQVL
jgi:hypothetical protein